MSLEGKKTENKQTAIKCEEGGFLLNLSKSETERQIDSLSQKSAGDGQRLNLF